MSNSNEIKDLSQLLKDEDWLIHFTTYKQMRSIIHQMTHHVNLSPVKLVIERDSNQNFITIEYSTGEKITI